MGPLQGIKIIELVGLGPGPYAGMMLADMGAEIIAIDRIKGGDTLGLKVDINRRGKKSLAIDLKTPEGKEIFLKLCESADALFEGFRPGVMEKMGLGPDTCLERNPKLVYGRMTGWGQDGPLSGAAGHDINYIALSGALYSMGSDDAPPTLPLNLVGDYGGGGMMLAFGLLCGIISAQKTGQGQVLDVSMVEGASSMMSLIYSMMASGMWAPQRGSNLLDGAAPFYDSYETRDGKYITIGSIELPFMKILIDKAELPEEWLDDHFNQAKWPERKKHLSELFKTKDQHEWCDLLEGSDACFAPVLPFWEAHKHPHNVARNSFIDIDGVTQPAPVPRFNRTVPEVTSGPVKPGQHSDDILSQIGLDSEEITELVKQNIVA